jgi:hypothetical protein
MSELSTIQPEPSIMQPNPVKSLAMKVISGYALLSAIFATALHAQTQAPLASTPQPNHIRVSAQVAEKHLRQKVEICYDNRVAWASRVQGTVVAEIEIDKNGGVLHATFVSGPALLGTPVLDAVERRYKYKPYLLNGRAVDVTTTVSVFVGLQCNSPNPYWIHH